MRNILSGHWSREDGWKEEAKFDQLLWHLMDQAEKQHFVNALATVNELSSLLLRALKGVLAGSRPAAPSEY